MYLKANLILLPQEQWSLIMKSEKNAALETQNCLVFLTVFSFSSFFASVVFVYSRSEKMLDLNCCFSPKCLHKRTFLHYFVHIYVLFKASL